MESNDSPEIPDRVRHQTSQFSFGVIGKVYKKIFKKTTTLAMEFRMYHQIYLICL